MQTAFKPRALYLCVIHSGVMGVKEREDVREGESLVLIKVAIWRGEAGSEGESAAQ